MQFEAWAPAAQPPTDPTAVAWIQRARVWYQVPGTTYYQGSIYQVPYDTIHVGCRLFVPVQNEYRNTAVSSLEATEFEA